VHPLDSAFVTVIVVSVIAYAAWATFRVQALESEVDMLRELIRLYRTENERQWSYWPGMTAEDVQAQIENMKGE